MAKMLPHHVRVLHELDEHTAPFGEMCVHFKPLAAWCDMARSEVRRITRHLARRGYAEYHKALWTEDGEMAGAGYCISQAGRDLIAREAA